MSDDRQGLIQVTQFPGRELEQQHTDKISSKCTVPMGEPVLLGPYESVISQQQSRSLLTFITQSNMDDSHGRGTIKTKDHGRDALHQNMMGNKFTNGNRRGFLSWIQGILIVKTVICLC